MKTPQYIGSFTSIRQLHDRSLPEFAFAGRSNVGKSSLINYLVNVKNLARVSKTPGKTQLLNFFRVDDKWHLVDLPGFGFAKVSKVKRLSFQTMITEYLTQSEKLHCVFLLIDSRIAPQKNDLDFANWMGENQIPFVLVFTKADRYPSLQFKSNIEAFKQEMLKSWEELPKIFITSAKKKTGREELMKIIHESAM